MNFEYSQTIGAGLLVFSSILGAYYLALKIRAIHEAVRDPNLAYVTHSHLEKLRGEFMRTIAQATQDLRNLRAEIREDTRSMQRQHSASLAEMRDLISKNAQSISALVAQSQLANQRICELTLKTDKLALKASRKGGF